MVASGTPPNSTCAPGTNPLPFIVKVKAPTATFAGLVEATVGYGFSSVTVALAEAVGAAVLVTVTITVPVLGIAAGGV